MERTTLLIATGLLQRGHEVDVLLLRPDCDFPGEIPERCRIFYLSTGGDDAAVRALTRSLGDVPARPVAPERAPWRVRCRRAARLASLHWKQLPLLVRTEYPGWAKGVAAYLDRERPDAVLAAHVRPVVATTMAMRLASHRARVVATLHNRSKRWRRRRISRFYPRADVLVGISPDISEGLSEITGIPTERIHTVYNPIVSTDISRKAEAPSGHPWLDGPDRPVILAAGRLEENKGFRTLLSAFAMLLTRRRARLIVLGKGPLLSILLSRAEDLGIRDHVDFPGFATNPYPFMAGADLFVLSSRAEGLPTVVVESMACGCPVVSTDCSAGPAEILEGGRLGELVPVGDAGALADAMDLALNKSPDGSLLRARAEFFGVGRAVDRYEALLLDPLPVHG